jgi:hypothetical protein
VAGKNCVMWGFIICDLKNSTLWPEKRKGRNRFEDVNIDGRIIIKRYQIILTGFVWPRTENTLSRFYIVYSEQNYDEVTNLCNTSKYTIL